MYKIGLSGGIIDDNGGKGCDVFNFEGFQKVKIHLYFKEFRIRKGSFFQVEAFPALPRLNIAESMIHLKLIFTGP